MSPLFQRKMKLAEVIAANHNLILMLPRFGIPLGFGEKTVQEVCDEYGVPVDFLLLVCNVYTYDEYEPTTADFEQMDMSMLVSYLLASHNYYLNERLPHIKQHLCHVVGSVGGRVEQVLTTFYDDYQQEVGEHFKFEECEVFPLLQKLQQGERLTAKVSVHFSSAHANIEDKLSDLTRIVYKYLPSNILPTESIELVFDILQLAADIEKHTVIEEKILLPYIKLLERRTL